MTDDLLQAWSRYLNILERIQGDVDWAEFARQEFGRILDRKFGGINLEFTARPYMPHHWLGYTEDENDDSCIVCGCNREEFENADTPFIHCDCRAEKAREFFQYEGSDA